MSKLPQRPGASDDGLSQFIVQSKIRMKSAPADHNPNMEESDWSRTASHFKCVLVRGNRRMTTYFSMGSAFNREPDAAEVLDSIAFESIAIDNALSFEGWCADCGYDPDSRRAERTYKVCQKQVKRARHFLGADLYRELLYNVERL